MNETTENDMREIDAFGFWPGKSSALVDRAYREKADDPTYAFHSPYVLLGDQVFVFEGHIGGLKADDGVLTLSINELPEDPGQPATSIEVESLPLRAVRGDGGKFAIKARAVKGCHYALVAHLSSDIPTKADDVTLRISGSKATLEYQQKLIDARQSIFRKEPLFHNLYEIVEGSPTLEHPISQACTVGQFSEPTYQWWLDKLRKPLHLHRKQWEFVYILQALRHYGALSPGHRGLGFGVGEEPLPALMAAMGCEVVATDLPPDDARVSDWSETGQHSSSLDSIRQPDVIDDASLERLVKFRPVDMTQIPEDLKNFDFTWSSCALEHVGSIAAGLDFIERSIDCLRPGGIAVHTTELNLISNDRTLDHAGTVLFRRRDFEEIAARLILRGHDVMPLNFTTKGMPQDDYIDAPPFSSNEHFKLLISQYLTTSFGIIVRRGA